jgi:hypothetical protein
LTLLLDVEDEREERDDDELREEAEEDLDLELDTLEVVPREDLEEELFLVETRLFPVMD